LSFRRKYRLKTSKQKQPGTQRISSASPAYLLRLLSDQVEPPLGNAGPVAFAANSLNQETVPGNLKLVLTGYLADEAVNGWILEFDHLAALPAIQVLVLRVAIVVLIKHAWANFQPPQQTGVYELGQSPINGCPGHGQARPLHIINELLGVEVVMLGENVPDHVPLLVGKSLGFGPAGKVFAKLALWAVGNFQGWI
jgi:hypothetical protein